MAKKAIGLSEEGIQVAIWTTEIKPTAFISLGATYKDSATLEDAEPEEVVCECEEWDDPEDISYIKGKTTLKWQTTDYDPASMAKIFGGEVVGGQWRAAKTLKVQDVAIKFTTRSGIPMEIDRGKLVSKRSLKLSKSGYGVIDHTFTKLGKPADTDGGEGVGTKTE